MPNIDKIKYYLGDRSLLEQLAEEAAELGKAALKLIRAAGYNRNVTPVTYEEAEANLKEELSDVLMCCIALGIDILTAEDIANNPKWERWVKRLEQWETEQD